MPPLLREPTLQFLAIGLILYLSISVLNRVSPNTDNQETVVTITEAQVEAVKSSMVSRLAARGITLAPNSEQYQHELNKAIDGYLLEELLWRDALAQGLDKNDPQIRRRLIEKARILAVEQASMAPMTEQAIEHYYQAHIAEYSTPQMLDIWQLFFDNNLGSEQATRRCNAALETVTLTPGIALEQLAKTGDRNTQLRQDMRYLTQDQLAKVLGTPAASGLFQTPQNHWYGPINTALGCHIVKVLQVHASQTLPLAQVKTRVIQSMGLVVGIQGD